VTTTNGESWVNPVALEIVTRGLKGREPIVPEWASGLSLPLADLVAVLDHVVQLYEVRGVKGLAAEVNRMRIGLAKLANSAGLLHL
jgi:hypothetical protein